MKTRHQKKQEQQEHKRLLQEKQNRAHKNYYPVITYSEMVQLIDRIGTSRRWRLEYNNYFEFSKWVRRHISDWPDSKGFELLGVSLYKREYVAPGFARLINEVTEAVLFIDLGA